MLNFPDSPVRPTPSSNRTFNSAPLEATVSPSPSFPTTRLRRLRRTDALRRLVRETTLAVDDLILPLFVASGHGTREPISSMPGHCQLSLDELANEAREAQTLGVPAVLLFGLPSRKDPLGSEAYAADGIVQRAVRTVKEHAPDLVVITDVCLCEYTSHGHCGVVEEGEVRNDPTLELLARAAVSHVEAGADLVAPSDMMDGRVGAIRRALDAAGYPDTPILAYAAKFASAFYGPFREAAESAPQFGDRRGYQMDPANAREALREVELDVAEGADMVMVKPALAYLDLVWRVRERFGLPVVAYNVSGEFAMVKAAAQLGWIDERAVALEMLTGIRRAGADLVITYFAKDVARWLADAAQVQPAEARR
jgi:porphobilinogen synthase